MCNKVLVICSLPLLFVLDNFAFTWIATMLRASSDFSVLLGVIGLCVLLLVNFYPLKYTFSIISGLVNEKK